MQLEIGIFSKSTHYGPSYLILWVGVNLPQTGGRFETCVNFYFNNSGRKEAFSPNEFLYVAPKANLCGENLIVINGLF